MGWGLGGGGGGGGGGNEAYTGAYFHTMAHSPWIELMQALVTLGPRSLGTPTQNLNGFFNFIVIEQIGDWTLDFCFVKRPESFCTPGFDFSQNSGSCRPPSLWPGGVSKKRGGGGENNPMENALAHFWMARPTARSTESCRL